MEIKRAITQKPEFCGEKKPIVKKKKKKSSCPTCSGEIRTVDNKEALIELCFFNIFLGYYSGQK